MCDIPRFRSEVLIISDPQEHMT